MGSGPRAGLAEIFLPELQKGSSIMPGKVNPVIPEVVTQVAAQVIGNDAAITVGGMQGHFELNVFVPLMARNLLDSIKLLASASRLLAEKCVDGIEANREQCERYAELTLSAATALNPYIGYDKARRDRQGGRGVGPLAARGRARARRRRGGPRRGARLPQDGQAALASPRDPDMIASIGSGEPIVHHKGLESLRARRVRRFDDVRVTASGRGERTWRAGARRPSIVSDEVRTATSGYSRVMRLAVVLAAFLVVLPAHTARPARRT